MGRTSVEHLVRLLRRFNFRFDDPADVHIVVAVLSQDLRRRWSANNQTRSEGETIRRRKNKTVKLENLLGEPLNCHNNLFEHGSVGRVN